MASFTASVRAAPVKAVAATSAKKSAPAPAPAFTRSAVVAPRVAARVAAKAEKASYRNLVQTFAASADAETDKWADIIAEIPAGVVTGKNLMKLLAYAKERGFAIPAVNVTSSIVTTACLEAAMKAKSPMIVQYSNGGGIYMAGKALSGNEAAVKGTISGAIAVRELAELYGVPIILHTDHCAKKLLPWFDGLMEANEKYFAEKGEPLFSSHMLDLSEEPLEENIEICKEYLKRMSAIDCLLEMELGITGGEEDGVDNSDVDTSLLYSQPEEIYQVYKELMPISDMFTVAAAFGNVHGVYKPGNVKLTPKILDNAQKYISEKEGLPEGSKPVYFVFHGGSGSSTEEIREAISYGVIKMNIDTDTQWSMWAGVKDFVEKNHDYLQSQIGNPEGDEKPNKKYYDPRAWSRQAELSTVDRLLKAYDDLNALNVM